jgi:hydrogenase-4 component B
LFYAAGAVYQATHTVDMEKLGGLSRAMPWTALAFLLGGVAISALPPLNGFTSEFVIYSGLFSGEPMAGWAKVALCAAGALLAFVGAVSALSITRAFGIVFLGSPRDAGVHASTEVSRWMLWPMGVHVLGVVLLGVLPGLGFALVRGPAALALAALPAPGVDVLQPLADTLTRIGTISGALALAIGALIWLRLRGGRSPAGVANATGPTWGCGYGAPNPRMQYTGSSFSSDFQSRFGSVMPTLRRQKAPTGYFPNDAYLITDCVDAVERRLFSVIKRGDASAADLSGKLREDDPRIAFAAALIAIVLMSGLVVLASGPLP